MTSGWEFPSPRSTSYIYLAFSEEKRKDFRSGWIVKINPKKSSYFLRDLKSFWSFFFCENRAYQTQAIPNRINSSDVSEKEMQVLKKGDKYYSETFLKFSIHDKI